MPLCRWVLKWKGSGTPELMEPHRPAQTFEGWKTNLGTQSPEVFFFFFTQHVAHAARFQEQKRTSHLQYSDAGPLHSELTCKQPYWHGKSCCDMALFECLIEKVSRSLEKRNWIDPGLFHTVRALQDKWRALKTPLLSAQKIKWINNHNNSEFCSYIDTNVKYLTSHIVAAHFQATITEETHDTEWRNLAKRQAVLPTDDLTLRSLTLGYKLFT